MNAKKKGDYRKKFIEVIEDKERKRIRAESERKNESFIWLRVFGIIGWSVITPVLLGIVSGMWIDKTFHPKFSFTLMFMFGGLMLGCFNVWNWLKKV